MARILIADRDPLVRGLLTYILKSCGYLVDLAEDGPAAVQTAIAIKPDLIITNVEGSRVEGFEHIRGFRKSSKLPPNTPILVFSTEASREAVTRSIETGANDFVSKRDLDVDLLLSKIAHHLGESAPAVPKAAAASPEDILSEAANAQGTARQSGTGQATPSKGAKSSADPNASASEAPKGEAPASEESAPADEAREENGAHFTMPDPDAIAEFLSGMLGKDVTVTEVKAHDFEKFKHTCKAIYVKDDDSVASLSISNFELAAFSGAALSLIPVDVAKQCVKKGKLEEELWENFEEVVNVGASLLNVPGADHVRLDGAFASPDAPDENANFLLTDHKGRRDYEFDIPDYGIGKMTWLSI